MRKIITWSNTLVSTGGTSSVILKASETFPDKPTVKRRDGCGGVEIANLEACSRNVTRCNRTQSNIILKSINEWIAITFLPATHNLSGTSAIGTCGHKCLNFPLKSLDFILKNHDLEELWWELLAKLVQR